MIFNIIEDEIKLLKYIDEKLFNENKYYNYYSN